MAEAIVATPGELPVGPIGRNGTGWWGMGTLIASEAALFGYLLFSYFYLGATAQPGWQLEGRPDLTLALPNTVLLLLSSIAAWWGERGVIGGRRLHALVGFALAFVMGSVFAGVQIYEYSLKAYGLGTSSFASLYFVTTGLHMAHVIAGLLMLAALFGWTAFDFFSPRRRLTVSGGVLYWHFVDAVWLCVFTAYYLTPYLGFGR